MGRHLIALALAVLPLATAPAAVAAPEIVSATVHGSPLPGQKLTVEVVARDAQQPVTGVELREAAGAPAFSESACRVRRDGRVSERGAFAPGRDVRLRIPYAPVATGLQVLDVTVVSGGCHAAAERTTRVITVGVGLPDLPVLPERPVSPPVARASATCPGATSTPTAANSRDLRATLLCLINLERRARGLRILHTDRRLRNAALRHTRDMVRRGFFAHRRPGGPDLAARLSRTGFWPAVAAENLGYGESELGTPASMVAAWMGSAPHRANILTATFRHLGSGIAPTSPYGGAGATYTADFGRR